jgi:hypothetical protein
MKSSGYNEKDINDVLRSGEDSNQNNKKSKTAFYIIATTIIIVVLVSGGVFYFLKSDNTQNDNNINQDKITDEEIVNNDGLDGNNEVNLNDNQIKKEEVESNNKIEIEESSNKSIKNNEVLKTLSVNFDDCVANGNKIIKISPRRCINEQGEEFYDYSFEGGYTPPDVNINTADIQKNMFPQGKDFSKFTNFDRSYVIFYQGYFNIIVNAYKAYELNGTYEDICYAQPEFIIQQYESSKKTIESEDPNDGGGLVIDFDKLVKSFDCFGSKEDYEIYFSLLQESGDYKEYTVSSKGPIFEIWD